MTESMYLDWPGIVYFLFFIVYAFLADLHLHTQNIMVGSLDFIRCNTDFRIWRQILGYYCAFCCCLKSHYRPFITWGLQGSGYHAWRCMPYVLCFSSCALHCRLGMHIVLCGVCFAFLSLRRVHYVVLSWPVLCQTSLPRLGCLWACSVCFAWITLDALLGMNFGTSLRLHDFMQLWVFVFESCHVRIGCFTCFAFRAMPFVQSIQVWVAVMVLVMLGLWRNVPCRGGKVDGRLVLCMLCM